MQNKKGTAMVEAAIIFPVIIFTVVTLMYMTAGLYAQSVFNTALHMTLTSEAGKISDTVSYNNSSKNTLMYYDKFIITPENTLFKNVIIGEMKSMQKIGGIVQGRDIQCYEAVVNVIDEEVYIRCADMFSELISVEVR